VGIDLNYFVDGAGFAKATCKMPGDGPTWVDAVMVVADDDGRERLLAQYSKIKPPLEVYERGLVEFVDSRQEFVHRTTFPTKSPVFPGGHTFRHEAEGRRYVYFANPLALVRARADVKSIQDLSQYEMYTCLKEGNETDAPEIDRDAQGRLRFAWRTEGLEWTPDREKKLLADGKIREGEALFRLRDVETGGAVRIHRGSVAWNEYRQAWVLIFVELFGTSPLGEVWFSEADQPEGPYGRARKIVTHDNYSFYNPVQHPMFAKDGGKFLYFEGTYTTSFTNNRLATPRYEYNQIMYRLDVSDPRLSSEALTLDENE
jgi:hypothetical protein